MSSLLPNLRPLSYRSSGSGACIQKLTMPYLGAEDSCDHVDRLEERSTFQPPTFETTSSLSASDGYSILGADLRLIGESDQRSPRARGGSIRCLTYNVWRSILCV